MFFVIKKSLSSIFKMPHLTSYASQDLELCLDRKKQVRRTGLLR